MDPECTIARRLELRYGYIIQRLTGRLTSHPWRYLRLRYCSAFCERVREPANGGIQVAYIEIPFLNESQQQGDIDGGGRTYSARIYINYREV
jgi:hypothetical protein